jgi:hypothetical protein
MTHAAPNQFYHPRDATFIPQALVSMIDIARLIRIGARSLAST